ncbi:MAG: hypothetical protein ACOC0C_01490 [Bacteroidota bacterium]
MNRIISCRLLLASLLILSVWSGQVIIAQDRTDSANLVQYTTDYEFTDGIYLNFEMVENNDPIPKSRMLTTMDYNDRDFFERLTDSKEIAFFDGLGVKKTVPTDKIWGYADNGVLFININNSFNRITVVGSICHFVANLTTYNTSAYDPYYYNNYSYRYRSPYSYPSQQTELRQYMLDFKTGKVYDYNLKSVEVLLMADPELADEYSRLRKKKKKQLKFYYIRKFNERNPLYLPKN